MSIEPTDTDQVEAILGSVVDEYLDQRAAGHQPDIESFASRHPDLANLIRGSLRALDVVGDKLDSSGGGTGESPVKAKKQLGDFRILRELGSGGMGFVYEAEQLSMGRHVALKILPMAGALQEKSLQRFRNEVRAASMLDHPNIVSIYSVGEDRGVHYYAMQLIRGQSLARVIEELSRTDDPNRSLTGDSISQILSAGSPTRSGSIDDPADDVSKGPEPEPEVRPSADTRAERQPHPSTLKTAPGNAEYYRSVARLGIQAAEALQHAHDLGVLHRDIKPGNLMLDASTKLHITDFGLARIEADAGMTMTGDLVGTLRYMSPEQALAKRVVIDHRSDIYSLGMTLYELVALRPAFATADRQELLKQIAFDEPVKLRLVNASIPREVETIIHKALEKDPDDRYATAEEMAEDLKRFLDDRPIHAKPPTVFQRLNKWARRHQAAVLTAAATLICAIVLGGYLLWNERTATLDALARETQQSKLVREQKKIADTQRSQALKNLYYSDIGAAQRDWERGQTRRMLDTLDRHLPSPEESDRRGWEWYYLLSLANQEELAINGLSGHVECVRWNPEGSRIAVANSLEILVIDATDGSIVHRLLGHPGTVKSVDWSPDGTQLVSCSANDNRFRFWDAKSGELVKSIPASGLGRTVAWSPDGRYIALGTKNDSSVSITLWDVQQQRMHWADSVDQPGIGSIVWSPDTKFIAIGAYGNGGWIDVWNVQSPVRVKSWEAHRHALGALVWSPDGTRLASGSNAKEIKIWDVETWGQQLVFESDSGVTALDWSADGQRLASATNGQTVVIYDMESQTVAMMLRGHIGPVKSVAWSRDSNKLVTGGDDRTIKFWDTSNKQEDVASNKTEGKSVTNYRTKKTNDKVMIRSARSPDHVIAEFESDDSKAYNVKLDRFGSRVAIGLKDSIEIWDLMSGKRLKHWKHGDTVFALCWGPDGDRLAIGNRRGTVSIWDAEQEKTVRTMPAQANGKFIRALGWSPDGRKLASTGGNSVITVWDSATGKGLAALTGHTSAISWVAWHPDGSRLASFDGNDVRVWDTNTWNETIAMPAAGARGVLRWSRDGGRLQLGDLTWDASSAIQYSESDAYRARRAWTHCDKAYRLVFSQPLAAEAEYRKAIELNPTEALYRFELARCLLKLKQPERAFEILQDGCEQLNAGSTVNQIGAALALNEAAVLISRTIDDTPSNRERTAAFVRTASEIAPTSWTIAQTLGDVEYKCGRFGESISAYESILERAEDNALVLNNIAWRYANFADKKHRDPQRAVQLAQQACDLAPDDGAYWNTLGLALYRDGQWEAAVEALNTSKEIAGGYGYDCILLSMAYSRLGNADKARERYDNAVTFMEKHDLHNEELLSFREEAEQLLEDL